MTNKKLKRTLLIVAVILLIAQLALSIVENEWGWKSFLNISVPILLIISFYIQIRQDNKQNK